MLQNEPSAEQVTPPGQVRITPEELSQAVAAIERRKEAEALRLAGTIPIDEAVSSLHLNATPGEIWAEVQSQRAKAAPPPPQIRPINAPSAQAYSSESQAQVQTPAPRQGRRRGGLATLAIVFGVLYATGAIPHFGHHSGPTPPALTATAAQITDGTPFYCDDAGLVQISEGKTPSQVRVDPKEAFNNSWTLVKMNGHIYLRAFIAHTDSVQSLAGKPLVVVNDDNSGTLDGEETSQTTLRVDGVPLQISGGDDGYTEITLPDFHPDSFTTTSPWH